MRSDPVIIVTCDWCLKGVGMGLAQTIEVGLTGLAGGGYDERNVDGEIKRAHWTVQDGEDICEDCWDNREDV